jgi:hypothetical protein
LNKTKKPRTYEGEILSVLTYEFSQEEHAASEKKIKRRLREKKLGAYDQARVDALRSFKDDLQDELHKRDKSPFYAGSHGEYSKMEDWDHDRLLLHLQKKHAKVPEIEIARFLSTAIYIYYLR